MPDMGAGGLGSGGGYGAVAGWVGSGLQTLAALLEQQAMGETFKRGLDTQTGFADQAMRDFYSRLGRYSAGYMTGDMDRSSKARQADYAKIGSVPLGTMTVGKATAPRDEAYAKLVGKSRANLGAYGDAITNQGFTNQWANRDLAYLKNFATGQASLLPYNMYDAQHSQDMLMATGKFLSSMGQGGSMFDTGGAPTMNNTVYSGSMPVQNWSQISPYWQQYGNYWSNYYNNPMSPGYIKPGTYE